MYRRFARLALVSLAFLPVSQALGMNIDNPFGKIETLDVGNDVAWNVDKANGSARKSAELKGTWYHLEFDNRQLVMQLSNDQAGNDPKSFTQLEVKELSIDGKSSALFQWCLNNQQRHNRFLQQGLAVKKDICKVDGGAGKFVMKLDRDTLAQLKQSSSLAVVLKPYRTPLEVSYDMADFNAMTSALNAKPASVAAAATPAAKPAVAAKKCEASAPAQYKSIKPVVYNCDDAGAKTAAESSINKQVAQEKDRQEKLAAEKEKQRKAAEARKQKELELQLANEKKLQAEAAALAASEAKQAQLNSEITNKMVDMCSKFWSKGESRCYCEKYIEFAPSGIKPNPSCN